MNIQTVIIVFLRLTALVLLYFITINTVNFFYTLNYSDWSTLIFLTIAIFFLSTTAIVFWFFPNQLCKKLLKDTDTLASTPINIIHCVRTGVILLGLTVFTLALIALAQWFIYYGFMNAPPEIDSGSLLTVGLLNIFVRLIVGALLLSKSHWITQTLLKINAPTISKTDRDQFD